ncbi:MAG: UbiX family flavin prenyltransferase [Nitrospirales bacterium]|nr:UbiX family flavin prenyltransferase [Nitrospirales bacterium]
MKRYVLGIAGASGSVFGLRVLEELVKVGEVHLVISKQSFSIIKDETGLDLSGEAEKKVRERFGTDRIFFHSNTSLHAPVASGSFRTEGMLVVPCSMKTLAGIAHGYSQGLIERAADVTIKEGRRLVISPRETPLSAIHLENMLTLARLGVRIVPPIPAFYQQPSSLDDMVSFVAGKILDSFGIENSLFRRWGEQQQSAVSF